MKITIVGTGYVGLVTAACLAEFGNDLVCVDLDHRKIESLAQGRITIHEPGLQELVSRNNTAGRLRFTDSYDEAVEHASIIFLAVGTPAGEDGSADLSHVLSAARSIGQRATRPLLVVNKSTVPVGTADQVAYAIREEIEKRGARIPISVVSNPEFLKEGAAVADFMRPDRIIIGADDEHAIKLMRSLYAPFSRNHDKLFITDTRSAELIKYAANAMLAMRISFMNELANLAEDLGADIDAVRHGIGSDPRIGPHFLYAGMGYGGSCFPKDVKALRKSGAQNGRQLHILAAAEEVNEKQKIILFDKLCLHFGGIDALAGRTIAIWGLAFKPNTGDMREAPSLALIDCLLRARCMVQAYDPVARDEAKQVLQAIYGEEVVDRKIRLADSAWAAVENADALVLVTEWQEFRAPDFRRLSTSLRGKALFDGRNLYLPADVQAEGLHYYGIGRNSIRVRA